MKPPRILIIAGSDSGGGAGIQADIKTVTTLGGFAMTAITAITAQNTLGVTAVEPVGTDMVIAQMEAVIGDIGVDAVKIGMIGSAETAHAVAERLEWLDRPPIVFDPVMVATSGAILADAAAIAAFERLMHLATVITPNAPELGILTGRSTTTARDVEDSARLVAARLDVAVLAKGGHIGGPMITDVLIFPNGEIKRFESARIDTRHTHGTGCTLASAIATGLGAGRSLADAVGQGRDFVRRAILAAPGFGSGHGPMAHWAGA